MNRWIARVLLLFVLVQAGACAGTRSAGPASVPAALSFGDFAGLSLNLSETAGSFPSDNLVSNEASYLHVLTTLDSLGVRGGAYVGVGPDQNFSYIARIRPEIVFLIDIRRDAVLQHLLYKALFEQSRNRTEFLCLLLGRPVPEDLASWNDAGIDRLIAYADSLPADSARFEATAIRLQRAVQRYGIPLSTDDLASIRAIHAAFAANGLDTRYSSRAGSPYLTHAALIVAKVRNGYMMVTQFGPNTGTGYRQVNPPGTASVGVNWRMLLQETDLEGNAGSYLTREESFRYLKEMHRQNRMIPVVGDLSGPHALASVGREIAARGLRVSAFYTSNVEQYLMNGPGFNRFAETVATLPIDEKSVIIRSYMRGGHAHNVPGYTSTQIVERIDAFVAVQREGGYMSYVDLVTRNAIAPPARRSPTAVPR
jgi:hypothetical protein